MTPDLTPQQIIEIVIAGVAGNFVYQGYMFYTLYNSDNKFPWSDRPKPTGVIMFIFTVLFKLAGSGYVIWILANSGQINGWIGAAIIGMASEEMIISLAAAGRKEAKNEATV